MKNWWFIVPVVIIFGLAIWGTFFLYQKQVAQKIEEEQLPLPTPISGFPTQDASPTPSTLGATQPETGAPNSQPETGSNPSTDVVITSPQEFSLVSSPLTVLGWSKIKSGQISLYIKDTSGEILGTTNISSCPSLEVCQFQTLLNFSNPKTDFGSIEAIKNSPNPTNTFSLVVQFK